MDTTGDERSRERQDYVMRKGSTPLTVSVPFPESVPGYLAILRLDTKLVFTRVETLSVKIGTYTKDLQG